MEQFGKNLKELRKGKHLSQRILGEMIGVSQDMISLYEIGSSEPNQTTLIKIAKLFKVSTDFLLGLKKK